jgi:hypothetical protein
MSRLDGFAYCIVALCCSFPWSWWVCTLSEWDIDKGTASNEILSLGDSD